MDKAILIDPKDNVITALETITPGVVLDIATPAGPVRLTARQTVEMGHKLALSAIAKGTRVIKYGAAIGDATTNIAAGDHVHSHNLSGYRGKE